MLSSELGSPCLPAPETPGGRHVFILCGITPLRHSQARAGPHLCVRQPPLPLALSTLLINHTRCAAVQVMSLFLSDTSAFVPTMTGFTALGK